MQNPPIDHFSSARRRVARAKTHIHNLNMRLKAFLHRKPYRLIIKPHPDGIHEIHKLTGRRKALPPSIVDLSTDAIENLRAALDHAMYSIAKASGVTGKSLNKIYFPFSSDITNFPNTTNSCCPGFRKEILTLLASFKPYHGGDDTLWAINEFAKTSKHKSLTPVVFNITEIHANEISGFVKVCRPPKWERAHNEFILGWSKLKSHIKYDARLNFTIGLEDVPIIAGKPIVVTLREMTRIVEGVLAGLEAESRRIGLFP